MARISVADYLVEFLISKEVTDVFGYQGGMVCHLFDSLGQYKERIKFHHCISEQGAAIAACSYAQKTGKLGVVITTSGPGFTNAITGVANAWFDSIPLLLISGQVNTKDKKRKLPMRQYGFQEIQAVPMISPIVKKAYDIEYEDNIPDVIGEAYNLAFENRRGPVYIDLPINVQRKIIDVEIVEDYRNEKKDIVDVSNCLTEFLCAKRPVILAGAGIKQSGLIDDFRELVSLMGVPVLFSMPGVDLLPTDSEYRVGFIGGTARRESGVVLRYADSVLAIGNRLCNKSIGYNHEDFAPNAKKIFRVELDHDELSRRIKDNEEQIECDLKDFITESIRYLSENDYKTKHTEWCKNARTTMLILKDSDNTFGNSLIERITSYLPDDANITADVGNNLVYTTQSAVIKKGTRVFISAGLGAMGYAIPASIGVSVACDKQITLAITGDGGAQMNIQELNVIAKEKLPIKVLVLNNRALGHIILFQDHYLDGRRVATEETRGDYYSCDFDKIAKAYGLDAYKVSSFEDLEKIRDVFCDEMPALIEVEFEDCSMLPNIHGGLDPLANGPDLEPSVVEQIKSLMEKPE